MSSKNDCDRVRDVFKVQGRCCERCHGTGELTSLFIQEIGRVRLCCAMAGTFMRLKAAEEVSETPSDFFVEDDKVPSPPP